MDQFRNIGIIGRKAEGAAEVFNNLKSFLLSRNLNVVVGEMMSQIVPDHGLQVCAKEHIGEACDLIIVIGGDGSLLGAARGLAKHDTWVLGVNRGRLGFLTDVLPEEMEEKVGAVLEGKFVKDKHFLLDVEVRRDGQPIGRGDALNDVVVNSGNSGQMIEFDLFVDDEFVNHQRSDGLIVSTPTGSTAYSLSAGGPIMHPRLDAIVMVPMFPHTLSSRPIVVTGDSEIMIRISKSNSSSLPVVCDGQVNLTAEPGDTVFISKKPHKLKLIHPVGHSFYASCRDKLGWSTKLGE
jgi:NAD+ kinase